ncbi:MAG: hypothetical protein V1897_12585 [Pseudomonadota bacterium]
MSRKRYSSIGFNRDIKMSWLDFVANLVLKGSLPNEIHSALDDLLKDRLSVNSTAKRSSREKTITILLKTWARPDPVLESLRDRGLMLFDTTFNNARLCLHWGMTMAAYPFCALVAETVGRLFRLQGEAHSAEVQRRVRERFGQRETVSRSTRCALRSFVEWGAIKDTDKKGVYQAAPKVDVSDPTTTYWMLEALLHTTESGTGMLSALVASPALFPFNMESLHGRPPNEFDKIEVIPHSWDDFILKLK